FVTDSLHLTFAKSSPSPHVLEFVNVYFDILRHYLHQLGHITTNITNTQFTVRGLQPVYLYLYALLDWHKVFIPRLLTNAQGAGVAVSRVLGAFVTSTSIRDELYRMGIPVWLVRPFRDLPNAHVLSVADLASPSTMLTLSPSRYKAYSIFQGRTFDRQVHNAIITELRTHTSYPNPFGRDIAPTNPLAPRLLQPSTSSSSSSSQSSASSSQSSASSRSSTPSSSSTLVSRTSSNVSRRTPYAARKPPKPQAGSKAWATALQNVNRHGLPTQHQTHNGIDLCYTFPEAAGVDATTNLDRRSSMMKMWLRWRPALLYCFANSNSNTTPMAAGVWKEFLAIDFLEAGAEKRKKKNGAAPVPVQSKKSEFAKNFYQSLLNEGGVCIPDSTNSSHPITWRGKSFDTLVVSDFTEILWEINELNFRFEFMALDSQLYNPSSPSHQDSQNHQDLVNACFPAASGSLLSVDVSKANSGMASPILLQRSQVILAIRHIMQTWDSQLPPLVAVPDNDRVQVGWEKDDLDALEMQIATFYMQSFFNIFHRATTIPRWLVHMPHTILLSPFHHKTSTQAQTEHTTWVFLITSLDMSFLHLLLIFLVRFQSISTLRSQPNCFL
ncbi:hypothetical protein BDN72DRAFT_907053, partial [Pluteus cervinus]